MDGFNLIKDFYSWVFNNAQRVRPTHISLYLFLWNQNNRAFWCEWFKCPYDLAMQGACIGNKGTYYRCLDDLQLWGLIEYRKGVNDYKAPLIKLLSIAENNGVGIPKSEPQTVPLTEPQCVPQCEQLSVLLSVPIYKLITNNIQLVNTHLERWIESESKNGDSYIMANFSEFVSNFNDIRKSKFSDTNKKLASQLNARLKEGFTIDQIISATKNAMREKYHIENRYRHLTPEFMLRQDKLEKYLDITSAPNEKPIELYDGKEIHESNGRRFVFYGETIKYIYPPVPDTTGWTDEEKYNYFTCDRFNDTWAEKYKNARDNQMNTTEAEKRGIYKYFYDQETLRFKIADHRNVRTS